MIVLKAAAGLVLLPLLFVAACVAAVVVVGVLVYELTFGDGIEITL